MAEEQFEKRMEILRKAMDEIKGYPPELQKDALNFLLEGTVKERALSVNSEAKQTLRYKKKGGAKVSGIRSQVEGLIHSDFFEKPKSMREISEKLAILGYSIELSHLSPILVLLVRKGELMRHRDQDGKYVYYKQK